MSILRLRFVAVSLLALLLLTSCLPALPFAQQPTPTTSLSATLPPRPTATPRPGATASPIPTATLLPTATFAPLQPTATLAPVGLDQRRQIFEELWTLVRDRYVYEDYRGVDWNALRAEFEPRIELADTEQFYALLSEMIERLGDEHSRYESPQQVADERARFDGQLNYAGIGALVRGVEDGGLITQLAPDGPAEQAGLQPRELIIEVEGILFTDTERFGPNGPIGVIRGIPGTAVRLRIRALDGSERDVEIVRRVIDSNAFPPVESSLLAGTRIGLLSLGTFNYANLPDLVRDELQRLSADGPLDGLIIDLRTNGGGRVDLMLETLAIFIDGGSIGSTAGRLQSYEQIIPSGQTLPGYGELPLVALISPETVSAGEMFAAGLQIQERAVLVGVATAGNTENLLQHSFSDGSRLLLAELTYRLPDGTLIEGRGVLPDRELDSDWWRFAPAEDPQITAALEELQSLVLR